MARCPLGYKCSTTRLSTLCSCTLHCNKTGWFYTCALATGAGLWLTAIFLLGDGSHLPSRLRLIDLCRSSSVCNWNFRFVLLLSPFSNLLIIHVTRIV